MDDVAAPLSEQGGDPLACDAVKVGDGCNREPFIAKRMGEAGPELRTGGLEDDHVGRQHLDGSRSALDLHQVSGRRPLLEFGAKTLDAAPDLEAPFDVVGEGGLDVGERVEEALTFRTGGWHAAIQ